MKGIGEDGKKHGHGIQTMSDGVKSVGEWSYNKVWNVINYFPNGKIMSYVFNGKWMDYQP